MLGKYRLHRIKYRKKEILLVYCNWENFKWYVCKIDRCITIYMNCKYNCKIKSRIIHKAIREN